MMTPPRSTSNPLYRMGFERENGKEESPDGSLKKTRAMQSTIRGTTTLLSKRIFSMPNTTTTPPSIVIARPNARGTPVIDCMIKSPPASIAQRETLAAKNIPAFTVLPFGISPFFPAIRNKAQISDINTDEIATFSGDDLPKKSAISRPEEKPAPIAVPMYNAAVLNDFFTMKVYCSIEENMQKSQKNTQFCVFLIVFRPKKAIDSD